MNRTRPCADCGRTKWIHARALCRGCYQRHREAGTLAPFPRHQASPGPRTPPPKPRRECVRCQRVRVHCARGLCDSCFVTIRRQGRLDDYPLLNWRRAELLAEWGHLHRAGVALEEAAKRLGISRNGLEKAIGRAGKRAA